MSRYDKKGMPHKGWVWECSNDFEQDYQTCFACGKYPIRYVHYLSHEDFDEKIGVGSECAHNLTVDYDNIVAREKTLKKKATRLSTFMKKEWLQRTASDGSIYYQLRYKGFIYKIMPSKFNNSKYGIAERGGWNFKYDLRTFDDARKHIFDRYVNVD